MWQVSTRRGTRPAAPTDRRGTARRAPGDPADLTDRLERADLAVGPMIETEHGILADGRPRFRIDRPSALTPT